MPLHKGTSKRVHSENVEELMGSYGRKGKIGNIKPKSKAHAEKIANAIAYNTARKAKRGKANPLNQGSSNAPFGQCPGGACPTGMPFLKK